MLDAETMLKLTPAVSPFTAIACGVLTDPSPLTLSIILLLLVIAVVDTVAVPLLNVTIPILASGPPSVSLQPAPI